MPTLPTALRNKLEDAAKRARNLAEKAAKAALEALAVHQHEPHGTMTPAQRTLRNQLRARARQLGDAQDARGQLAIGHLKHECAYEHWHRMLFARFLAENNLLIEPDSGVAVSLDECKELAKAEQTDLWTLAGRYAQTMLPEVFRADDPVLQVPLAREDQLKLEEVLDGLAKETFTASDSLGWCYQFWQAERKKEVNESGNKIGADELPSVTQLFTEDYMVDFLLDNTLGAWWAGKVLTAENAKNAEFKTEEEVRRFCALPGCPWKYLRFVRVGSDGRPLTPALSPDGGEGGSQSLLTSAATKGRWTPAAGTFEGWPKTAKELKCLDPCCGSGHFLVGMFERLVALRMAEEGLDEKAAVAAVIRDNLFGLELDPRCTQIGAFSVALAAWRRVGHCALPAMHIACSGLAPNTREADWLAIAGDNQKLQRGMERLYQLFQKAAVLGSLINPRAGEGDLLVAAFHELQPLLEKALAQESKDDTAHEMAVTAHGLAKAAEILASQFTLVATNVPYRGSNDLVPELKELIEAAFPRGRSDLATCFLERCIGLCADGATTALVSPQAWLFIGPYRRLREHLLRSTTFRFVAQLGKHAFETIGGEVVNVNLTTITRVRPQTESAFSSLDVSGFLPLGAKASALLTEQVALLPQLRQLENPDARIVAETERPTILLRASADSYKGIATGDLERFIHYFWEHTPLAKAWSPLQGRVDVPAAYGGREQVVLWENGCGQLHRFVSERLGADSVGAWLRGDEAWQHRGIAIGQMTSLPCTIYLGDLFDENTAAVIPKDEKDLPAMWAYCQSQQYRDEVKKIDNSSLKIPNLTLIKVPFDLAHWQKVAAEKYPHGLPKPFSSDPTQWLFNGHPAGAGEKSDTSPRPSPQSGEGVALQVAVARLLGYQWPRQTGSSFPDCPALGEDGLEKLADADGIVCIPSVRGEEPAAERLRKLLQAAYGADWKATAELDLIRSSGSKAGDLDEWLLDDFFEQHCDVFQQRPFIWHIWDGRKRDGFHALVNYHTLAADDGKGRRTLETVTHSYLNDWISRQKDGVKRGEEGAEERLAAALALKERLEAILTGEGDPARGTGFDIFVRWKPLAQQPIGWEPDLNDGVRVNIRPFLTSDIPGGKKGAGILRAKPGIKWDKDRGKEPHRPKDEYPWFWKDGAFTGDRVNDFHLTNEAKRKAREA